MRIVSWNVNGLRAAEKKGFSAWLGGCGADVVGVQEVRARSEQLPAQIREPTGWHLHVSAAERGGYSGVALFSRRPADSLQASLGIADFDAEGRFQLARFGPLTIANVYFPNGSGRDRDQSRIPYKLAFYRRVFELLDPDLQAGRPVLVMGDFNTAHREVDLARPRQNVKTSGFRPEERAELDRWLAAGWTDTFRMFETGGGHYSWWSQRVGVRERNVGWRIDYVLASPGAVPHVRAAFIDTGVMGSDHCPVGVVLDDGVLAG